MEKIFDKGFVYRYNPQKDGYIIVGLTEEAGENLVFPATYNGKKIYEIDLRDTFDWVKTVTITDPDVYIEVLCPLNKCFPSNRSFEVLNYQGKKDQLFSKDGVLYEKPSFGFNEWNLYAYPPFKEGESFTFEGDAFIVDGAFMGNTFLKEINLPYGMTEVPEFLCCGCTSLTSINLPATVMEIGAGAFANCTSLKEVIFNETLSGPGVMEIGAYAFENCKSLKSIELPSSISNLAKSAFSGCSSLTRITGSFGSGYRIKDNVVYGVSLSGWNSIIFVAGGLKCKDDTFIVNKEITSIAEGAFASVSLIKKVIIPSSIQNIDRFAFDKESSIEEVIYEGNKDKWATLIKGAYFPESIKVTFNN